MDPDLATTPHDPFDDTPDDPVRATIADWLWPLVAGVVVAVAWWPVSGGFWQSDDWIAVHYAIEPSRALSDFVGNYFGVEGLVWFYRPLITLSWMFNAMVAGAEPFVAHATNAVAQGAAAAAIGRLVVHFTSPANGFFAGLAWGISPVHAGAVLWAAGRTGTFTVLFAALSLLFLVRWIHQMHRTRALALVFFVLALCTKELAIVIPGLAAIACFALAMPGAGGSSRLRLALQGSWPFFVMLAGYFLWRWLLLGRFIGGYGGEAPGMLDTATGLGTWTLWQLDPLLLLTPAGLAFSEGQELPSAILELRWLGLAPVVAAVLVLVLRRRFGLLAVLGAAYLVTVVPSWQFWAHTNEPQNLRYFTLPFAVLVGLYAACGSLVCLAALLCAVLPFVEVRGDYERTWEECARIHRLVSNEARDLEDGLLFVHGLPRHNERRNVVAFHHGVDRILEPPFGDGRHRVFALRPLAATGNEYRVPFDDMQGVPLGVTLIVGNTTIVHRIAPMARPKVDVEVEGGAHLTSEALMAINEGRAAPAFVIGGPRASHYRLTVFTGSGYMTSVVTNEALEGAAGGRVSLRSWLTSRTGRGDGSFVATDLYVPTVLDLRAEFPVLIEAGSFAEPVPGMGARFSTSHVAREFVWMRFDRNYAEFMTSSG